MIEKFIALFQLLVELKENKSIPEKFEKELDRNIHFIKQVIENPKLINSKKESIVISAITFLMKIFNSS